MALDERDPHTGYMTTGHEWNGIKELNTPVPRVVYFFLIWRSLPLIGCSARVSPSDLYEGLLGSSTNHCHGIDQTAASNAKPDTGLGPRAIRPSRRPKLMTIVRQAGRTLFGDNCAACHGFDAKGGKGFPDLTTASWLWGGDPETIAETIRVGINSAHPNTRSGQMLAFGRDRILQPADVDNVVDYVLSLSDPGASKQIPPAKLEAGKATFAANCAVCHGSDGKENLRSAHRT